MGCCAKCGCVINSGVYCKVHEQNIYDYVDVKTEIDPGAVAIVSFIIGLISGMTIMVIS